MKAPKIQEHASCLVAAICARRVSHPKTRQNSDKERREKYFYYTILHDIYISTCVFRCDTECTHRYTLKNIMTQT